LVRVLSSSNTVPELMCPPEQRCFVVHSPADISCMPARHIPACSTCALALPCPLMPRTCSLRTSVYALLAQPLSPRLHPDAPALCLHSCIYTCLRARRAPSYFICIQAAQLQCCRPLAALRSHRPRTAHHHRAPRAPSHPPVCMLALPIHLFARLARAFRSLPCTVPLPMAAQRTTPVQALWMSVVRLLALPLPLPPSVRA
jgi:hypothetical protein